MSFVGWALSLLSESPLEPLVQRTGWAWCSRCDADREVDVIPPNDQFKICSFTICMFCGACVDTDIEGDAA